jgi:drug/metabolite transporter (DMT)-like permease
VRTGTFRCAIAAILFGISAPAASRLTDDMGAFTLAGLLYLGAALAVAPFARRSPPSRRAVRASLPYLSLAVVLGGAVGPVLLAVGLGLVPAATASLLLNLELVLTTIVAGLVFREHLGRPVIAGTALVVAGSVVLTWSGDPDLRWGALVIAAACLCWAIDNSATAAIDQIAPSHITLAKGTIAGGANLVIGLTTTSIPAVAPVLWALLIGGVGYGASITLWVAGARDLGAARGQLVFATAPFVGAVVAWTVFTEPFTAPELAAFAIAAGGVAFVVASQHDHDHSHVAMSHTHDHEHDEHHDHLHEPAVPGRHTHPHDHRPMTHRHPHVPDLHHRHDH